MTNDSTHYSSRGDSITGGRKSPRHTTLMIIRQFARVYMNLGSQEFASMIMN